MARMSKFAALCAVLASGCGYHHVVVESRVVVFAPTPISVSTKIDLTKSEQKGPPDASQRQGEDVVADGAPQFQD
jgi:hypothetical protein